MKNKKFLIFLICYLAYTSIYIARLNLTIAGPELQQGLLNEAQFGLLGSLFSILYAGGRMVSGYLGDKKSPAFMIATGLCLVASSNLAIGFLPPFVAMLVLWGLNALGQSMLWSSMLRAMAAMYEPDIAKRKTTILVSAVATGNILGILLNTLIVSHIGLAFVFILPGALAFIFSLLIGIVLRDVRPEVTEASRIPVLAVFRDPELRKTLLPALFHGVMKDNISLWVAIYVVDMYAVDLKSSSWFILFIPVMGFIGRIAYPAMYRILREKDSTVSACGFLLAALASLLLLFPKIHWIFAITCLGLIYAAVSLINTSVVSIFPMKYTSRGLVSSVSGLMDFFTYLGAGLGSLVYGIVISATGSYVPMFLSWIVISLISVLICLVHKKSA